MYLTSLSLLLLASWPALAAPSGDIQALALRHDKRDFNLLNHPYPRGYSAASCSRGSTNIFGDHGLVPQQTPPEPSGGGLRLGNGALRMVSARANQYACCQIGSFLFTPVAQRVFTIQMVRLLPGCVYVLSIEANVMVQYLSAHIRGEAAPYRQRTVEAEPYQAVGELHVSVVEPSEVFFLVTFQSQFARGEVALFSIGPPELGARGSERKGEV